RFGPLGQDRRVGFERLGFEERRDDGGRPGLRLRCRHCRELGDRLTLPDEIPGILDVGRGFLRERLGGGGSGRFAGGDRGDRGVELELAGAVEGEVGGRRGRREQPVGRRDRLVPIRGGRQRRLQGLNRGERRRGEPSERDQRGRGEQEGGD